MPKQSEGQTRGFGDSAEWPLKKNNVNKVHQTTAQIFWPAQQYCQENKEHLKQNATSQNCKQYTQKKPTKNKSPQTQC